MSFQPFSVPAHFWMFDIIPSPHSPEPNSFEKYNEIYQNTDGPIKATTTYNTRFNMKTVKRTPVKRQALQPNSSFTLFSKLPLELKYQIWKAAMPGPALIEVELPRGEAAYYRVPSCLYPVLLKVCKESRELMLRYYQPSLIVGATSCGIQQQIYMAPNIDILYLDLGNYIPRRNRLPDHTSLTHWFQSYKINQARTIILETNKSREAVYMMVLSVELRALFPMCETFMMTYRKEDPDCWVTKTWKYKKILDFVPIEQQQVWRMRGGSYQVEAILEEQGIVLPGGNTSLKH